VAAGGGGHPRANPKIKDDYEAMLATAKSKYK